MILSDAMIFVPIVPDMMDDLNSPSSVKSMAAHVLHEGPHILSKRKCT